MGNGVPRQVATTVLTSLNSMFGAKNMTVMQQKYVMLNSLYPDFLSFTADTTDRHVWRKRTLRHAGWLLTSEVDFTSHTHVYPGKNFKKWLKWLTWVQTLQVTQASVTINGQPSAEPPARAIMDTLKAALEDKAADGIGFDWSEKSTGLMTVAVDQRPGRYGISVQSIQATGISNIEDNDEDDNLP